MRKLLAVLVLLTFAACSGDPTGTGAEGEIVDLVLAADSITFVQTGVDLERSLYGITSEGDTVYNPDGVTFDLPEGFTRDGDVLRATREASGMVVASLNPSDSVLMRSAHHLDSLAPWGYAQSCFYDNGASQRPNDGTDSLYSVDSVFFSGTADSVSYVNEPHRLPIEGYGTAQAIYHWEDGQVDTVVYDGPRTVVFTASQSGVDTITASRTPIPAVQNSPRRYMRPDSVCGGYDSTGVYLVEQL